MNNYEIITEIIFVAIDELNQQSLKEQQVQKSTKTVLTGQEANIDSMALVNLIVIVEDGINNKFGVNLSLLDERALSQDEDPFRTVSSFIDYVALLLTEEDIT